MIEKDFFLDILKATPIDSIIETTEYIDTETAIKLGLIHFIRFIPNSVGLAFSIDSENFPKLLKYIENSNISNMITHYWIYNDDKLIANGFDYFDTNEFDEKYYTSDFKKYQEYFHISFVHDLNNNIINLQRKIEITKVTECGDRFIAEINLEINMERFNLKFEIEKQDFENLSNLLTELHGNQKIIFRGIYSGNKDSQELGITIKSEEMEVDLMINTTKRFLSNLLWFQEIEKKQEIERLFEHN